MKKRSINTYEHDDCVNSVAFSPDGKRVATGCDDNKMRLFSTDSTTPLQTYEHGGKVTSVAFSPDGKRVATGCGDGKMRLFSTDSTTPLQTYEPGGSRVTSVAFSPDGKRVATGCTDCKMRLFSTDSTTPLQTYEHGQNTVLSVAFSPDGKRVATGCGDGKMRLFSTDSTTPLQTYEHGGYVWSVAFSPDGNRVATGCDDKKMRLFSTDSTTPLQTYEHGGHVTSVAFSLDGKRVATGCDDKKMRLFSTDSTTPLQTYEHGGQVTSVAFSPDGKRVATGCGDGKMRLFSTDSTTPLQTYEHDRAVTSVAFSPDGNRIATGCGDEKMRLFSIDSTTPLQTYEHGSFVWSVAFSPDGKRVATGCGDDKMRLFSTDSTTPLQIYEHNDWVRSVAFSPDGKRVATGCDDKKMRLFSTDSTTPLQTYEHDRAVTSVAFSPDGKRVATGCDDGKMRLFSTDSTTPLQTYEHGGVVYSVAFSPDGKRVATGCTDGKMRLFGTENTTPLQTYEHDRAVTSVAFSPDGKRVATGCDDGKMRLFSTDSTTPLQTYEHGGAIWSVAFSPDSTAAYDLLVGAANQATLISDIGTVVNHGILPLSVLQILANQDKNDPDPKKQFQAVVKAIGATKHPQTHVSYCQAFFDDLARQKSVVGLQQTLFNDKLQYAVASLRWNTLLDAAVKSKSVETVELVLDNLADSIVNKNAVDDRETTRQMMFLGDEAYLNTPPVLDFALRDSLCEALKLYPDSARKFLDKCPLVKASKVVNADGFGEEVDILQTEMKMVGGATLKHYGLWKAQNLAADEKPSVTESLVTPFAGLAAPDSTFLRYLVQQGDSEYFGSIVADAVVRFKWDTFGLRKFKQECVIYGVALAVIIATSFLASDPAVLREGFNTTSTDAQAAFGFVGITGCYGIWVLGNEVVQMVTSSNAEGIGSYFGDPFNSLDLLRGVFLVATTGLFFSGRPEYIDFLSLMTFAQYLGSFYFLQPWSQIGTLIRMIIAIVWDIKYILLILLITLCGFANALLVLFRFTETIAPGSGFDNVPMALLTSYKILLLNTFEDNEFIAGPYTVQIALLFVVVTLIGPVVLLNLMIARMSDSYERIQDESEREGRRLKAKIILGFENAMTSAAKEKNKAWFPAWIHILVRKGKNVAKVPNKEWVGVLADVKKSVEGATDDTGKQFKEMEKKNAEQFDEMRKENAEMRKENAEMEQKIDEMEKKNAERFEQIVALLTKGEGGKKGSKVVEEETGFGFG